MLILLTFFDKTLTWVVAIKNSKHLFEKKKVYFYICHITIVVNVLYSTYIKNAAVIWYVTCCIKYKRNNKSVIETNSLKSTLAKSFWS